MTAEQELALRLAGTGERRRAAAARIEELAGRVDFELFLRELDRQLLLPLAAARLEESAPGVAPAGFREPAERQAETWRRLALAQADVTLSLLASLEAAGIAAVPLKGPLLAEQLYGDPGLRFSSDVDLLVHPSRLDDAVAVLSQRGYGPSADLHWNGARPLLHHALPPERPGLPPLDVHWRIHWNETALSAELLSRAAPDPRGGHRLQPADELLALLLFYGRNSLYGLRLAADVAACWDRHGAALAPEALADAAARPELRDALTAAAFQAGRLVGLPWERLLGGRRPGRRARLAARLADWEMSGTEAQRVANLTVIDWLLSPRRQWRSFASRHMFQPPEAIARTYGRPRHRRLRNRCWRVVHGTARAARFAYRYPAVRWRQVRKDRRAETLI